MRAPLAAVMVAILVVGAATATAPRSVTFFENKVGMASVIGTFVGLNRTGIEVAADRYMRPMDRAAGRSRLMVEACVTASGEAPACVAFPPSPTLLAYFERGINSPGGWQDIHAHVTKGNVVHGTVPTMIWADSNGWILGTNETSQISNTFASSYNGNADWDKCNNVWLETSGPCSATLSSLDSSVCDAGHESVYDACPPPYDECSDSLDQCGLPTSLQCNVPVQCPNPPCVISKPLKCVKCSMGYYSEGMPVDQEPTPCQSCGKGKSAPNAQTSCTECAAGQYQDETTASEYGCKLCAQGNFQGQRGQTSCVPWSACAKGSAKSAGSTTSDAPCTACSNGYYQGSDIPAGKSTSTCRACGSGQFQGQSGQISCAPWSACAKGSAKSAGSTTSDAPCTACPDGYYQGSDIPTGDFETPCTPWQSCGKGFTKTGGTATNDATCSQCPGRQFQDRALAAGPDNVPCADWRTCPQGQGRTDGTISSNAQCADCGSGRYQPSNAGEGDCLAIAGFCSSGPSSVTCILIIASSILGFMVLCLLGCMCVQKYRRENGTERRDSSISLSFIKNLHDSGGGRHRDNDDSDDDLERNGRSSGAYGSDFSRLSMGSRSVPSSSSSLTSSFSSLGGPPRKKSVIFPCAGCGKLEGLMNNSAFCMVCGQPRNDDQSAVANVLSASSSSSMRMDRMNNSKKNKKKSKKKRKERRHNRR